MRNLGRTAILLLLAACGGGGGGDDGDPVDANPLDPDAFGGGPPIEAPDDTWTWVPFPDSRCMNDTPTGVGVNWHSSTSKVLIYMEGGGACFNTFTCNSVAHQNGFGANDLNNMVASYGDNGVFNRADDDNPFRDWNYVFVPYCSGDVHAGLNEAGIGGRTMVGYRNVGLYLDRIVPTFRDAEQVVVTGSSAGGFGAAFNYDRVAQAFAGKPVFLLDDSGPPLSDTYMTPCFQTLVRDAWKLNDTLPADCAACREPDGGGMVNLAIYLGEKYGSLRQGLVTANRDGTIRTFFGFGYPSCTAPQIPMPEAAFAAGVEELTQLLAPYPSFKAYVLDSAEHVWLLDPTLGGTTSGGVGLTDWLRALLEGGGDWQTVRP